MTAQVDLDPAKEETPRKKIKKKKAANRKVAKKKGVKRAQDSKEPSSSTPNYPRHSLTKALRIPRAIIDQNAGKECSQPDVAVFLGVGYNGPFQVEISSALKYGLIQRLSPKQIIPTDLAKKILRPQSPDEVLLGMRAAVLNAPTISDVYKHYRGENLPDRQFFENALTDNFNVPPEKLTEFIDIFSDTLTSAQLLEKVGEKFRVIDVSSESNSSLVDTNSEIKKLGKSVNINVSDSCFVMMPFASPLGDYYSKIYEVAIKKAGLNPLRADNDIFGTGKIVDQIWSGITSSKVLLAELTSRNPNVFYELGLAHALRKPVVLVSSNEEDVPFDLQHIRVIYYNVHDPFWGNKLIDKVAENILSALKNPEEAILFKV